MLERFSSHCISDSFTFAKTMQNLDIDPNVFMCSFDVSSLFTNVPLDEAVKICSEALYDQSNSRPIIPKDVFVELMKSATSSVEFSFNNTMYKQTDGVAMGSPLGPALANILLLLLFTRPLPRDGGMAEDHGAPEAGQLPRVWTRGHKETDSRQRVSGAKSP